MSHDGVIVAEKQVDSEKVFHYRDREPCPFVKKHLLWHNEQRSTLKSRDIWTRFMTSEQTPFISNPGNISIKWNLIDLIS